MCHCHAPSVGIGQPNAQVSWPPQSLAITCRMVKYRHSKDMTLYNGGTMGQLWRLTQLRPRFSGSIRIVAPPIWRRPGALTLAGAVSLLAGTLLVAAPASAAPSSTYAVTEVPSFCCVESVAADQATDTVYATSPNGDVEVIDGANNTVSSQISVSNFPGGIAVDQASDTVYAIAGALPGNPNGNGAYAEVINGSTDALTTTISLPAGLQVGGVAANPVTHMVYAVDSAHSTVVVIDGSTDEVAATIPLTDPTHAPDPSLVDVAVDTATNTVYVSDGFESQVAVISGVTNTVTGWIAMPGGSFPAGVAVDSTAGLVYVADEGSGAVSVINTTTDAVSTLTTGMTEPFGLALDSGAGTLYVSAPATSLTTGGTTYAIDTTSGAITAQIPRGGESIAVAASGGSAFVGGSTGGIADQLATDVTVITPSTASTLSPIIFGNDLAVTFVVGQDGQDQLTASASPAATFSSSNLPAWLTISSSGLLSGTPPADAEGSNFGIDVTAANGIAPPDTESLIATVDEAPAITSAGHVTFQAGEANSFTVTATGSPAPTFFETGALPSGVTFSAGGVLSGTPTTSSAGAYPITITATNGTVNATQAFTLTVAAPPAAAAAVGVEGSNGAMYVQSPQLSVGWHSEGGDITGPPAVAAAPNANDASPVSPLFVATGTDGHLYIRSLSTGWQEITPVASCLGSPAAMITGSTTLTLTVACEGTNRALYYDTATVPASGLPAFTTGWAYLGGTLSAGPAVATVGGTTTFFALGTSGHIYTRTVSTGFAETPWACIGSPAAAVQAATGETVFGCQGTNHALWYATSTGTSWTAAASLGGSMTGGPGIAATSAQIEFYAEGTGNAVYQRTLTTGWASLGGSVLNGAAATALN